MSLANSAPARAAPALLVPGPRPRTRLWPAAGTWRRGRPGVRDTGVWDPGVLGIQVVRRAQLNGPKRVANTAQGWHPLRKGLVPRSFGKAGWRGLPGPACSGNTRPARRPASGGGGGAGGEAGPASPPLGFPPGRYLHCLYRIRGRGARGPPGGTAASQYGIWPLRETECVCLCIYPARCNVILLVEGVCEIQY